MFGYFASQRISDGSGKGNNHMAFALKEVEAELSHHVVFIAENLRDLLSNPPTRRGDRSVGGSSRH